MLPQAEDIRELLECVLLSGVQRQAPSVKLVRSIYADVGPVTDDEGNVCCLAPRRQSGASYHSQVQAQSFHFPACCTSGDGSR